MVPEYGALMTSLETIERLCDLVSALHEGSAVHHVHSLALCTGVGHCPKGQEGDR